MDRTTVFTKTAKGITQVNQKSASLSKDLMKVLKLIDGKSNFGQLIEKAEIDKGVLEKALNTLAKDGFARIFETRKEEPDPFGGGAGAAAGEDDFDFTAPSKAPAATQRVIAGAANDISELVHQQEKVEADKKSREQAHEAARLKAKAEVEARARAEAEARSHQQAEQQAMEQARKAKEASERAKAELESQMREEVARKQAIAQQQAKLTAEQQAKQEEEGRRLAELRVKAEREAKALAEARARAEAEAAAMAKARAEADAAAKRQAAEASNAEAAMKARLKEEIESRIRGEMEELLRNEVEEKTRASMQAEIMAEAKLAAKAELEERLREEREAIATAENEARAKAEKDASARADMESKKRAEAEARAAAETEARMRAEEETRKLRAQAEEQSRQMKAQAEEQARRTEEQARHSKEVEARARDAEARARQESEAAARERAEVESRVNTERQAKYEAEARMKIEAEDRVKRERELSATIDAERKAKEEAELRARIESKARETIEVDTRVKVQAELEADLEKKAEIEGKAQAKAYMSAKAKAELDEDERLRAEQSRKAREIADVLRTKVTPDQEAPDSAPAARRARKRKGNLVRTLVFALVGLLILAVVLVHVVPMPGLTVKVERAMSAWLHDDVSIASTTFRLIPAPHLKVENLSVGKALDAKAATGRIFLDVSSILGDKLSISSIELDNVSLNSDAVKRIPEWGKTEGKSGTAISSIVLRGVKIDVKPPVDAFNATLSFARDGAFRQAQLTAPVGWSLGLKPGEKGVDVDFSARNWTLPIGAPIPVSDIRLKGVWSGSEIVVPEFEADAMEGKVNGTLRVSWAQGVKLESDLSLARVISKELVAAFTKDIAVTGRLEGNFVFAAEGPSVEELFAATRAQGKFKLGEGTISNVDLVAVMQSDAAGQRAGVTKFAELTGELSAANRNLSYRQLNLQGGVLRGSGAVDIGANSNLSGRLSLEIRSQVAQDRGAFSVSGTVGRPIIRRGG